MMTRRQKCLVMMRQNTEMFSDDETEDRSVSDDEMRQKC